MKAKRSSDAVAVGDLISQLLDACRKGSGGAILEVSRRWQTAVGGDLACNARPVAIKGGLLLVHVSSSVWLHHLQFVKRELIDSINAAGADRIVEEIKFRIGPV